METHLSVTTYLFFFSLSYHVTNWSYFSMLNKLNAHEVKYPLETVL